jgi:hypothetical protein
MQAMRRIFSSNQLLTAVLAGASLLVSGCASWLDTGCARFEKQRQGTDYATHYRLLDAETKSVARQQPPLPRASVAAVHLYEIRVEPYTTKSCRHVRLHKEVHFQRRPGGKWQLEETREFYALGGALIATRTESIGNQLTRSGFYAGSTLLPIPEKAPPGRYRVVSKLVLKSSERSRGTVLAQTSASFQVISRNN